MKQLDVCLSPDLIELYDLTGKVVVVIDIFRATSCMTTGIAHGVQSIKPVATLAECKDLQNQGYIAAAERGGKMVEGFDLGNSPYSYMDPGMEDARIAMTTTNGTLAITKSMDARQVLIGSFLNLTTLVKYLKRQPHSILLLCAGWKGKVNMEDSLFAGAVVKALKDNCDMECDAPKVALTLYERGKSDLENFVKGTSHYERMKRLKLERDAAFCLKIDEYKVIPVLKGDRLIKMGLNEMLA